MPDKQKLTLAPLKATVILANDNVSLIWTSIYIGFGFTLGAAGAFGAVRIIGNILNFIFG